MLAKLADAVLLTDNTFAIIKEVEARLSTLLRRKNIGLAQGEMQHDILLTKR